MQFTAAQIGKTALVLWACSLALVGIVPYYTEESLRGITILYSGWLGLLLLNFAWIANLLFAFSVGALLSGHVPRRMAIWTVVLSLDTFRLSSYPLNEGGASTPVYGYGWGAVLWLSAMFLLLAAVGAKRRERGEERDWLQPAGVGLLTLWCLLVAVLAIYGRVVANPTEARRLENLAFKRGKVCAAEDPVVAVPITTLAGPVELKRSSSAGFFGHDLLQVKPLLDWGIPVVRFEGVDYSLSGSHPNQWCGDYLRCKALTGVDAVGAPAAVLYVSQEHLEYMRVRLVEFGTDRTVIDQTWARADYPVNTDIYCPDYKRNPRPTEQPRLLLTQALGLRERRPE